MPNKPLYLFYSNGIARIRTLRALFPSYIFEHKNWIQSCLGFLLFIAKKQTGEAGVIVWGKKTRFHPMVWLAKKQQKKFIHLEDGFLRSVKPATYSPLSLIWDQQGIYYDASHPSDLENIVKQPLNENQVARAQSIKQLWCRMQVSKYNHAPNISEGDLFALTQGLPFILLIDQTLGDASVDYGLASTQSFEAMLMSALEQQEVEKILIKTHPEVVSGKKRGYLHSHPLCNHPRISIIHADVHLPSLLSKAHSVYTVSSQSGFEALLWNVPVRTFGMPFYAGWGLTSDSLDRCTRRKKISLEQLIYACLVVYPKYLDPETNQLTEVESTILYLGFQRQKRFRFNAPLSAKGFSPNKLHHLKRFTQGASWANEYPAQKDLDSEITLVWGALEKPISLSKNHRQIQVEDGFLRSAGLGASLARPYSWVFDEKGMYYDATRSSDLEELLQYHQFSPRLIERSYRLQERIISLALTKYNHLSGTNSSDNKKIKKLIEQLNQVRLEGKEIALIIGQVETDASIRLGGIDIFTNEALINAVCANQPHGSRPFTIYKPHPDVAQGLRKSKLISAHSIGMVDLISPDIPLTILLEYVDQLHTISSLSGFEALIRGKKVFCYGIPFYAGWGLTIDRHVCPRRTRKITIAEMIAASLIIYPTYLHPQTDAYCQVESYIEELSKLRDASHQAPTKMRYLEIIKRHFFLHSMRLYHRLKGI